MQLMSKNTLKHLSIILLSIATLAMAVATVVERLAGTAAAQRWVYHAPWFIGLWIILIGAGCVLLSAHNPQRRWAAAITHVAIVLIFMGSMVTHFAGTSENIHLRMDGEVSEYQNNKQQKYPFILSLHRFTVEHYRGSQAAENYEAVLLMSQPNATPDTISIGINRIAKHSGYRIYLTAYDDDERGVSLTLSHDPVGIALTYTGYALLLLGLAALLFGRNGRLPLVLKQISAAATLAILLLTPAHAQAAQPHPPVFPEHVGRELGRLYVYHNHRVAPLQSLARDYTMSLYGSPTAFGLSPEQVLSGLVFYPNAWEQMPLKQRKHPQEQQHLRQTATRAEVMRIFPHADSTGIVRWFGPADKLPQNMPTDQWMFFKNALNLMGESVHQGDWQQVLHIIEKIGIYQQKEAAEVLPSAGQIRAERLYNRLGHPKALAMACTTVGLLLFAIVAIAQAKRKQLPAMLRRVAIAVLLLVGFYLALVLGLRWVASGHVPMANGFEVMLLMSCMSALLVPIVAHRAPTLLPMGFVLAGLTMLVAVLGESNPPIGHLMPVLQSPLLSIHVACMMLAYTLFGLAALNGILGVCTTHTDIQRQLVCINLTALYPALFLLTAGTCIGAVWGNISWGSYWFWDPKETWALISIIVYTPILHISPINTKHPRRFHIYCLLAFASIIITYFGVNMLLGGVHSYAQ